MKMTTIEARKDATETNRLCENVLTASSLRRSFLKDEAGSANRVVPTTNGKATSKKVCAKMQIKSFYTAWALSGGSRQRSDASAVRAEPDVRRTGRHRRR
jgi:hypothetical protein